MESGFVFFMNSILLGGGLAMDAFSVSLANGLNEPKMKKGRMCAIAGLFSFFQFIMPMIGWFCVCSIARYFLFFDKYIPWIALVLLCFIGGKMLHEGLENKEAEAEKSATHFSALLVQGIATSIDALSVGFTIAEYNFIEALIACLLIAATTFLICFCGLYIGKRAGTKLAGKASILGGVILIFIGIEIFISGIR